MIADPRDTRLWLGVLVCLGLADLGCMASKRITLSAVLRYLQRTPTARAGMLLAWSGLTYHLFWPVLDPHERTSTAD